IRIDGGAFAAATSPTTFSNLSAGSHTVDLKDANNCPASQSITVGQASSVVLQLTKTDVQCNGGSDGSVTPTFSGGTPPYMIRIDGGAFVPAVSPTTFGFNGLAAGSHTVDIKDANNCPATVSITVNQPAVLTCSASATPILCFGGSSTVTVSA